MIKLSRHIFSNGLNGLAALLTVTFFLSSNVVAQVAVVELGAGSNSSSPQASNNNSASSSGSNDVVINLYLQLEALQQEVQTLRGTVEEQSYQIRRMQTESRDRYIDIDSRLSGLSSSTLAEPTFVPPVTTSGNEGLSARGALTDPALSQGVTTRTTRTNRASIPTTRTNLPSGNSASSPSTSAVSETSTRIMPQNEQELYRTALNLLVEDGNYEDSINMFQQYIDVYSSGRYLANAYYWQGEALILVERFNQAKEVFMTVVNNHPGDAKAPGALMKLVVTYIQMGDMTLASQSLQDLRAQYPDSLTEISAAEDYLRKAGA